jgi:hypothetical protein
MRAVADVQAEGLRAAGELLERMLGSEPEDPGPRRRSAAGDYGALVEAWTDLLRRTVDGLAAPGRSGALTAAVDAAGAGPQLRLTLGGSRNGDGAATEVWLHNGTFRAVGPLGLRCGPLVDPGGGPLDGAAVGFEPAELDVLPARSSRAIAVSLTAPGAPRPGTYRGTIQARGAPALWLPLEVVIGEC